MRNLILITYPEFFPGEQQIIVRLFEEGLTFLHLRKPGCKEKELEKWIKEIPESYYPFISFHDCFELAERLQVGGIHINSRSNRIPVGYKGRVSKSCHSLEEISSNLSYDYLFLSPIFESISKQGYGSGFSLESLKKASWEGTIQEKIIALGGLDTNTIPQLKGLNFGGYAVLGAVWGNQPSGEKTGSILKNFRNNSEIINSIE